MTLNTGKSYHVRQYFSISKKQALIGYGCLVLYDGGVQNIFKLALSGANLGKIPGARKRIDAGGIVRDKQRRSLPKFARPEREALKWLISALHLFGVAPRAMPRRQALKSSILGLLNSGLNMFCTP